MTQQNDNFETRPAVEPAAYESPPPSEQNSWIRDTNLLILVIFAIFVAVIAIYMLAR